MQNWVLKKIDAHPKPFLSVFHFADFKMTAQISQIKWTYEATFWMFIREITRFASATERLSHTTLGMSTAQKTSFGAPKHFSKVVHYLV